ncbi:MAG: DUF1847 domain-containing protein [Clostridiales bacterium]|jgi:uncharacterized metal-binding protein|nr:DUF1847 domain-containing protein [Clostridiales bacterium]
MDKKDLCCVDCRTKACEFPEVENPKYCVSDKISESKKQEVKKMYVEDEFNAKIFKVSSKIEGNYYGQKTRVEETVMFLEEMGAKNIGIISCVGTLREAGTFSNILREKGFNIVGASCKVGSFDKTEVGICEEDKICPNTYEAYCNPIMQAIYMNDQDVDFVVAMGLCVGHDTLLFKYCKKPVTVLFTKDRVTGHNPVAVLYNAKSYYRKKLKNIDTLKNL